MLYKNTLYENIFYVNGILNFKQQYHKDQKESTKHLQQVSLFFHMLQKFILHH